MRYKSKKGLFGKVILVYSLTFISVFTVVVLIIFAKTGYEPSSLVQWVYTFWGLEIAALLIKKIIDKKSEIKQSQNNNKNTNEDGRGEM